MALGVDDQCEDNVHAIISRNNAAHCQGPRVLQLLESARKDGRTLHISAPMVRYSKLPFRLLVRDYNVDITYTPMILASEFNRSYIARDSDFTTHPTERGSTSDGRGHALIAQFAASSPEEFARAADLISPWVDGVDLNCGCPQSWAIKEGIGCSLMENPELVASMVRETKSRIGPTKSVSVKIRIHKDLAQTMQWVRVVEDAGVDWITVHGRTRSQRSSTPPDYGAMREVKASARVPVFANGDVYCLEDVKKIVSLTQVDGVMAARGILENPALFAWYEATPRECIRRFISYAVRCPIPFPLVVHHISEMTGKMAGMSKKERKHLMACQDFVDLIDYIEYKFS